MVGGEVLGPRPARDGEDRLEVDGRRAAETPVVAREEEAQERAAQGLGAELVHGFCGSAVAGATAPNPGRLACLLWLAVCLEDTKHECKLAWLRILEDTKH